MEFQGGLSEVDANKEMDKMMAFIRQEAKERVKELHLKADEDFNIEKAKLVRSESATIDALFQKKMKQAEVQRKIAASNYYNKSKLRVLQLRQQLLEEVFGETRAELTSFVKQGGAPYTSLMEQLLTQGCLDLLETHVIVQCRPVDVALIEKLTPNVQRNYQKLTHGAGSVQITVDQANPLPDSAIGGVIVATANGRIKVLNTLESRMDIACEQLLPEIRVKLYGAPPNRRFYD